MPIAQDTLRFPEERHVTIEARDAGPVLGTYRGQPIVETLIDHKGRRFTYDGLAPRRRNGDLDVAALGAGEWVLEPGLVYRLMR